MDSAAAVALSESVVHATAAAAVAAAITDALSDAAQLEGDLDGDDADITDGLGADAEQNVVSPRETETVSIGARVRQRRRNHQ